MRKEEFDAWLEQNPTAETVIPAVCDLNGTLRGKRFPISQIEKFLSGSLRMPVSVVGVDVWGEDIENSSLVFETGDGDGLCHPTGRGLLNMSWTKHPTALAPMWLSWENGEPFMGDPRRALDAVTQAYKARGWTPVVATELEFYLVDPDSDQPKPPKSPVTGKRLDSDDVYSIDELQHFDDFLSDVFEACRQQGIPADSAISENGAGQFEINMTHVDDPLRAADDAILFKRTVRGVARKHGMAATFMAKPYGHLSGSGFHVHFSLIDEDGNNVFDNGEADGTDLLRHAVAGLLETMAEHTLIFAPHENSYRRLRPGTHAPSSIGWGYENRTAAVRVPGGNPKARRVEHRVAGADANPYLVLASVLGGAFLGIENAWQPPAPIEGDAYSQDLPRLPPDWASAIEAFRKGQHVKLTYDRLLHQMLVDCKRQELGVFKQRVTDFEYHTYLETV